MYANVPRLFNQVCYDLDKIDLHNSYFNNMVFNTPYHINMCNEIPSLWIDGWGMLYTTKCRIIQQRIEFEILPGILWLQFYQ